MTYDFYAHRDQGRNLEYLADFELVVHGQLLNEQWRLVLQQREDARQAGLRQKNQNRSRVPPPLRADDAKNDAKRSLIANRHFQTIHEFLLPPLVGQIAPTATSLGMTFTWRLSTPFFSRGVTEFCCIDNPVNRDRLSNCPILHATGAKGMLRAAFRSNQPSEDSPSTLYLFGNNRDIREAEQGQAGALVVGDVFFNTQTRNEVFSPHKRKTRTVDKPISFEMVPQDSIAQWGLLLFDYTLQPQKVLAELPGVLQAVDELITIWGMSAKRSSGYGVGELIKVTFHPGSALALPEPLRKGEAMSLHDARKLLEEK